MRWWGWGREERRLPVRPEFERLLRERLGVEGPPREPVALADVALPAVTLGAQALQRLEDCVGAGFVRNDPLARILHAGGKSYLELVRMRAGAPSGAPDAVVYPSSHEQVLSVLAVCGAERIAVVPFGGGTSIVGGLTPSVGAQHAVVALDLARLAGILAVDPRSLTVSVAAGTRAPALEAGLAEHDLTLGHYPDSFEFVSIGGCAATRSVGQASSGYGRIDQAIQGVRIATPVGELAPAAAVTPPTAATTARPMLAMMIRGCRIASSSWCWLSIY